jgi:uncharacterized membrane protein HdeD (DUF308 family)
MEAAMPIGLPAEAATLRRYSTWFVIYGVVLGALGLAAIAVPNVATLTVTLLLGWLLLITGAFGLIAAISAGRQASGFWWHLLTSIVYALAGLVLLTQPLAGVITLTIILAAYLLAGGLMRIFLAFGYRAEIPGAWNWMLLSGIVDILLAGIIMSGMPGTATWVLGLLVGINLLMMGTAVVMVALAVRRAAS